MRKPILSVLIPAYNAEKYVGETLASLQQQTFTYFEILIADDGSTDNTREIIDSYSDPRIFAYHNEKNVGKTKTVEKLFSKAQGKYITIHDADDTSTEDRFSKQISFLEVNEDHAMCGCSFNTIKEDGDFFYETIMPNNYQYILMAIKHGSQFHGPTMVIRKNVLDKEGEVYRAYFKENNEDTDLAYRIVQKYKAINLHDILYNYRILANSLCRRDVSIRNRNLYKVVAHLGAQRAERGYDDLMIGRPDLVDAYFDAVTAPYKKDRSLINREAAAFFMHWRLKERAVDESLKAIKTEPFKIINWRTLLYCLRKG